MNALKNALPPLLTALVIWGIVIGIGIYAAQSAELPKRQHVAQYSGQLCLLAGEQVSGLNKICYYDCAGSSAAITISNVSLCPFSINR